MLRTLTYVGGAVLVAAWAFLLRPPFLGGPASYVIVSGHSMEPTLYTGDLVIVHERDEYVVGDMVAFEIEGGSQVIHRIVGGSASEGFVLQGDNNDWQDQWRPTPDQILGSEWVHVEGAGNWLSWLQRPMNLGLVLAGIVALPQLWESGPARRRRRRGKNMAQDLTQSAGSREGADDGAALRTARPQPSADWLSSTATLSTAFGIASFIAVLAVVAAAYTSFQPLMDVQTVERLRYEHTSAFDYAVQMAPATLYPDGVVQPVVGESLPVQPSSSADAIAEAPPESRPEQAIYTQLAQRIVVDFTYTLESSLPPEDLTGELTALLEIRAGTDGWRRTQELIAPVQFTDAGTSAEFAIDLAPIRAMIAAIEEETGARGSEYELAFSPTVRIEGSVGGEPIDEVHAPTFTFTLGEQQIVPGAQLTSSDERVLESQISKPARVEFLGWSAEVASVREASTIIAIPAIVLSGMLAAVLFLGFGRSPASQIQARYGSMLLPLATADTSTVDRRRRVRVGAFRDLVRLAKREEPAVIFHQHVGGWDRYTVEDGATVFEYRVEDRGGGLIEFLTRSPRRD